MIGVAGKLAFVVACLGLEAGCSSLPGGDNPGSTLANLVLFNSTTKPPAAPPPGKAAPIVNLECPQIEVQDGTSSVRVYAGADQSNANLRYQFSLGDTARECQLADGRLNIKVGVAGRVLAGPAGAPSTFTVPVRIVIRRESDEQPAVSQLYRVAATIPTGDTETDFTVVSDPPLSVPFLHEDADRDYTILVGFDQGAGPEKAPAPVKRRKRG
jgi:hypothetical protein